MTNYPFSDNDFDMNETKQKEIMLLMFDDLDLSPHPKCQPQMKIYFGIPYILKMFHIKILVVTRLQHPGVFGGLYPN